MAVAVNVPVLRDGALRYVLSASMSPAGFAGVLASARIPADALGTIVDRKGIVIAHTGGQERVGKPAGPGEIAIADQTDESVSPVRTPQGWDAYATFATVPRSQFAVGLAVPAERVDAPLRRALRWLSGAVLAAFGVSLSLALLAGRRLTKRVAGLAHALRAFGRGETVRTSPGSGWRRCGASLRRLPTRWLSSSPGPQPFESRNAGTTRASIGAPRGCS